MCWLFRIQASTQPKNQTTVDSQKMDDGDFHSGPSGYSPNTPYPETQYGYRFDEEASWFEED